METKSITSQQPRCINCGQYFRPENRTGTRQKSCKHAECQRKRQQEQQEAWRKANPDYFKGRYGYVKKWRKAHPGYQKQWRAKKADEIQTPIPPVTPITSIRLNTRAAVDFGEIQTLVMTLTKAGQSLWVTGARMQPG